MRPTKETTFLPLSDIAKYSDKDKYYCSAIVFSPDTENNHFAGCPPYIKINSVIGDEGDMFFEVPEIIAYYGKVHAGYTMAGKKKSVEEGKRILRSSIKLLLEIK